MKKLASLSLLSIMANLAIAEDNKVEVKLGGKMETQYGVVTSENAFNYAIPTKTPQSSDARVRKNGLVNNNELYIEAVAKLKNMRYGGKIVLNADNSANTDSSNNPAKETLVFAENNFGRIEAGATPGVSAKMSATIMPAATGGAYYGDWSNWVNQEWYRSTANEPAYFDAMFISKAALPADTADSFMDATINNLYANKISYYTPSFSGFRAGFSYIPDTDVSGTTTSLTPSEVGDTDTSLVKSAYLHTERTSTLSLIEFNSGSYKGFKDVMVGALNIEQKLNDYDLKLSLTGQTGSTKTLVSTQDDDTLTYNRNDLKAFEVAGSIGYKGFAVGGSFANLFNSGQSRVQGDINRIRPSSYWTLASSYTADKLNMSLSYLNSKAGNEVSVDFPETKKYNRTQVISAGISYHLASGLLPYAECNRYSLNAKRSDLTYRKNQGFVVLTGVKVLF